MNNHRKDLDRCSILLFLEVISILNFWDYIYRFIFNSESRSSTNRADLNYFNHSITLLLLIDIKSIQIRVRSVGICQISTLGLYANSKPVVSLLQLPIHLQVYLLDIVLRETFLQHFPKGFLISHIPVIFFLV